ncbi:MAG: hypothetical protein AB1899_12280, partial [Pseudomonadota bacterium]
MQWCSYILGYVPNIYIAFNFKKHWRIQARINFKFPGLASIRSVTLVCSSSSMSGAPNPALNLAPFGRWTLRDKAAQRRLANDMDSPHPNGIGVPDWKMGIVPVTGGGESSWKLHALDWTL